MAWTPPEEGGIFRALTDEEEESFREHARTNDPPDLDNWEAYHPVCREEWEKRGLGPVVLNGYKAFFRGEQVDVRASTSLKARDKAAILLGAHRRPHEVSVVLCEKDGKQVTHNPTM